MAKKTDKRGAKKGSSGQQPHKRNATAAAVIESLAGFGLPQIHISEHLAWLQDEKLLDLGGQGYSPDTLQRHYRAELDAAKIPAKELLMHRAYQMAMMDNLPEGVSVDAAYRLSAEKVRWLLNVQHGVVEIKGHQHSGPKGGPIPISLVEATLTPEEIETLAYLTGKLERAAAEQ